MNAQIHRFHDRVALYAGKGETVYIEPSSALRLAKAIRAAALECKKIPFRDSKVGTTMVIVKSVNEV